MVRTQFPSAVWGTVWHVIDCGSFVCFVCLCHASDFHCHCLSVSLSLCLCLSSSIAISVTVFLCLVCMSSCVFWGLYHCLSLTPSFVFSCHPVCVCVCVCVCVFQSFTKDGIFSADAQLIWDYLCDSASEFYCMFSKTELLTSNIYIYIYAHKVLQLSVYVFVWMVFWYYCTFCFPDGWHLFLLVSYWYYLRLCVDDSCVYMLAIIIITTAFFLLQMM